MITISELTTRSDCHKDAVKSFNKRLHQYCRQNQWNIVNHNNITETSLNKGGLHLSRQGNELLYKNFKEHFMNDKHWFSNSFINAEFSDFSADFSDDNECTLRPSFSPNPILPHNLTSTKRSLKLASLNVNELSAHIDELRVLLHDQSIDVLAIQETKLDVTDLTSTFLAIL